MNSDFPSYIAPSLVEQLKLRGIPSLTSIQKELFPPVMEGKSVLAHSKTGTGKTLAYLLPLVQRAFFGTPEDSSNSGTLPANSARILVLVPTRELAVQVESEFSSLVKERNRSVVIVGGEDEERQVQRANDAWLYVATPGRLMDLMKRRRLPELEVNCVVFDEADRLLDMGFIDDMRDIMKRLRRKEKQVLFVSATTHFGIEEMSYEFGCEELLHVGQDVDELTVDLLDHKIAFVGEEEKFYALANYLKRNAKGRGIVFSNYRDKAHHLTFHLQKLGCRAEGLTAQLSQNVRRNILVRFQSEEVQVLIASDLAARGIDVKDLDFVVNYDLPEDPTTYVHRVGRTARAGKKGEALSFVGYEDSFRLEKLEKFLGKKIERVNFSTEEMSGKLPQWERPQDNRSKIVPKEHWVRPVEGGKSPGNHRSSVPQIKPLNKNVIKVMAPSFFQKIWARILKLFGIKSASHSPVKQVASKTQTLGLEKKKHFVRMDHPNQGRAPYRGRNSRPQSRNENRNRNSGGRKNPQ